MNAKLLNKDFGLLWLGMAVSQLGVGAGNIGLMWWIQSTTGSALLLGAMAMVRTIVSVALSPFSGVVADRFSKKAIIVLGDVFRGLFYGILGWLIYTNQLTPAVFLILVGCNAICSTFFNPAVTATVPLLVSKADLPRANSLQQITSNLVTIAGYASGGILVALLGVPMLLAINAAAFLLSALSEMFIHIPPVVTQTGAEKTHFWLDLKEGFNYARQNRVLIEIMKVAAVLNFVWAPTFILLPKFVQEHLGASSELYGYLLAAFTVGTLCASLLIAFTKVVERNLWLIVHSITPQAIAFIIATLLPTHWHAARIPFFLFMGFLNGVVNIYFGVVVQRTTAPEHLGRVAGLINTMTGALQPLSQGLTGYLGDIFSIPVIYVVANSLEALCGIRFSHIPNLRSYLAGEDKAAIQGAPAALSGAND